MAIKKAKPKSVRRSARPAGMPATRPVAKADPARKLAVEAARTAHHDNAEDAVVLDLRGASPVTDYFVICTGTSGRQMRSVADDIIAAGAKMGQKVWQTAGMDSADWIVLDFVDVVVHIFSQTHRKYYDLELIWGASPRVTWKTRKSPAAGEEQ
ncbi:MAG: ribosome silencing factor [Planctomycetes bacterium]|nr:ribosome silencing factor [Planctomycetota bacterium]